MALEMPDMSAFLNPPLCANNNKQIDSVHVVCQKSAGQACGGCNLVQYCSKECQVADWPYHKKTCKSAIMKGKWAPEWYLTGRRPAFVSEDEPLAMFGNKKYLWGNMPALEILKLSENEGIQDLGRDLHLLFAASGDLRNVIKTIVGLPEGYNGNCTVVLNDKDFTVVARNIIMLLSALHFDVETAVPVILHLWYSALLPASMVQALQLGILPLVADVCDKIKGKPKGSLQAKTFTFGGRTLRLVLKKEDWAQLATYFEVPAGMSANSADEMRRRVTLAPERIDYRERAMLQYSPALQQVDNRYREKGILLPYGCSTVAFDTPNPTLFHDENWPMKDNSAPGDGWDRAEYVNAASGAHADEYGAMFFFLRDLLQKFCTRLRSTNISFRLHHVDAQELYQYVDVMLFDRIELANICDWGYLGPHKCLQIFSELLKSKQSNPHATLLMLFINAAAEIEQRTQATDINAYLAAHRVATRRTQEYMPVTKEILLQMGEGEERMRSPELIRRMCCNGLFKDWETYFNVFMKEAKLWEVTKICGLRIKKTHTLVQQWPSRLRAGATQAEFQLLRSSSLSGYERYMEFERAE